MSPVVSKPSLLPPSLLDVANGRREDYSVKTPIEGSASRIDFGRDFSDRSTQDVPVAPASKRVTVYDIARKVGVSHTTVARALGNRPDVAKMRREEIQRVAAEMGYAPDPHLSALANYRKKLGPATFQGVIAWINHWRQPDQLRRFGEFEKYWQGAAEAAQKHGFKLEDFRWPLDCSPKRLEGILVSRGVEGILIPPHGEMLDWADFDWTRFCVVRFGLSVQKPGSNSVTSDHFRATEMAVTRLREYGYQRIGLAVDFELDQHLGGNYCGGFAWAQKKLNIASAVPIFTASAALYRTAPEKEIANVQRWLMRYRPDVILTTQRYLPEILAKLGCRVPKDVAVAATSVCDIPVDTGIDQRSFEIGRIAMDMLVKQISVGERGASTNPCRILVESCWRDGNSAPSLVG